MNSSKSKIFVAGWLFVAAACGGTHKTSTSSEVPQLLAMSRADIRRVSQALDSIQEGEGAIAPEQSLVVVPVPGTPVADETAPVNVQDSNIPAVALSVETSTAPVTPAAPAILATEFDTGIEKLDVLCNKNFQALEAFTSGKTAGLDKKMPSPAESKACVEILIKTVSGSLNALRDFGVEIKIGSTLIKDPNILVIVFSNAEIAGLFQNLLANELGNQQISILPAAKDKLSYINDSIAEINAKTPPEGLSSEDQRNLFSLELSLDVQGQTVTKIDARISIIKDLQTLGALSQMVFEFDAIANQVKAPPAP